MKKITGLIILVIISISIFLLGFDYRSPIEPNTLYQVYLDEKVIGVIKSKEALEKYIDEEGAAIKEKYGVSLVYAPNGLEIRRINTYQTKIDNVEDIYKIIENERPFTIKGYQFTIKSDKDVKKIYVIEKDTFDSAITETKRTFVGTDKYLAYEEETQKEIETTGSIVKSIYVENDMSVKEMNIPVTETIYTDSKTLAKFLMFGTTEQQRKYTVKDGDTIEMVSFNNEISVDEFLMSNPKFTSSKNLLFPGQEVVIGVTNPQIKVVVQEYVVQDIVNKYSVEYIVDPNLYVDEQRIVRKGQNGLTRVAQEETWVNGSIAIVSDPESKEELVTPINQIVKIGAKALPSNVGSTEYWGWPTNSGWTITSQYGYRINPISGVRELHDGIDIAGTGFGSNIYAANNGTVIKAQYHAVNGNYVIVDHNNGFFSLYAHLNAYIVRVGQTVARGQVIGYMGHTGWATGTHLHFSIYDQKPFTGRKALNPWSFF